MDRFESAQNLSTWCLGIRLRHATFPAPVNALWSSEDNRVRGSGVGEAARQRTMDESGNDCIELVVGDVSSIAGVQRLERDQLEKAERNFVLMNSARDLRNLRQESDDGLGMHFAVNVLATCQKKTPGGYPGVFPTLAPQDGLEPPTRWLTATCSTN